MENCTACPTHSRTVRGNIQVAVCETRGSRGKIEMAYTCVCGRFPQTGKSYLSFFAQIDGNSTRCIDSWEMAPHLYTTLAVVAIGIHLYMAAQCFYVSFLSGMCRTKAAVGSFFWGLCALITAIYLTLFVSGRDHVAINGGHNAWIVSFNGWTMMGVISLAIGQALICTSVADFAYPGEDKACCRRSIGVSFWCLAVAMILVYLIYFTLQSARVEVDAILIVIVHALIFVMLLYFTVFVCIAHKTMHQVMLHHTSREKHLA